MLVKSISNKLSLIKENYKNLNLSRKDTILYACTILKYLIAFGIFAITRSTTDHRSYITVALVELFIVGFITNWLAAKHCRIAYLINCIFTFLLTAQMLVLYFGATFIELIMLTNLDMLEDLGGNSFSYGIGVVAVLISVFLPIKSFPFICPKRLAEKIAIFPALAALWASVIMIFTTSVSPSYAYVSLTQEWLEYRSYNATIKALTGGSEDAAEEFYSSGIVDAYSKDEALVDEPNVILIFTEGLSQNIVEDEREIMPNYAALEEKSLFVENYFNHTAATFRGILGQLFSGYQYGNYDPNYLISLQSILSDEGYSTTFINTESNNEIWTDWLNTLGFDQVISDSETERLTDKQAYEYLEAVATELNGSDEPFFITMYTFGTHVSWDSPDETYGDGSDPLLNRFYNTDYWIGEFLEWFETSELAENTILVFTSDHCSYKNDEFVNSFPEYKRTAGFCDRIPLCIYYVGIEATTLDAENKNSLDLAPTILDYLDISAPNYFLGTSLFNKKDDSPYDTYFSTVSSTFDTSSGTPTKLTDYLLDAFQEGLTKYLSLAANGVE